MRLISPFSRIHCPFCFVRFHLSEAPLRRRVNRELYEPDHKLGVFLGIAPPQLGPVVEREPPVGLWQRICRRFLLTRCDIDEGRRVCPHCHLDLPFKMANGELRPNTIAVVGARNSGKSNYLGILIHALSKRYAEEVNFGFFPEETFDLREHKRVLSTQLFKKRYGALVHPASARVVARTESAESQNGKDIRIPLIYRVTFPAFLRRRCIDLVLFDAAGEDLEQPEVVEHLYRYVSAASGVVFVLDPLELPGLASQVTGPNGHSNPQTDTDLSDVVKIVLDLFEKRSGLAADAKLPVPAAFAVAKADLLDRFVHPSSSICRDSTHEGGFNAEDCEKVSEELVEYLRDWGAGPLIHEAKSRFEDHQFFAVSALGRTPNDDNTIGPISPRRVADPLLWILWRLGYLPEAS